MNAVRDVQFIPPPPAMAPSSVEQSRAEVEQLYEREQAAARRLLALRAEEADASSAGGVLDGPILWDEAAAVDLAGQLGKLHAQQILAARVVSIARERRRTAIRALYVAEAAALRADVDRLTAVAEAHEEKTAKLLSQLQAHEGCSYVPLARPPLGDGAYADPVFYPLPHSQQLRNEAETAAQRALQLERRPVADQGALDFIEPTAEDVIKAIVELGPLQLGPDVIAAVDWLTSMRQAAEAQRKRGKRGALVVSLVWEGGALDTRASRATLRDDD